MKTKRQVFGEAVLGISLIWLLTAAGIAALVFLARTFGLGITLGTVLCICIFSIMTGSFYDHLKGEYRKKGQFVE